MTDGKAYKVAATGGKSVATIDPAEIYDRNVERNRKFAKQLHDLLKRLLDGSHIKFQNISYRVKEKESFCQKCKSKDYSNPSKELMDFVGLRIITYLSRDAEKVCTIMQEEFNVIDEHSVDKKKQLHADRVGYISYHYIATLNDARGKAPEWKEFKDIVFEVQIRTLLQHAWAEIEHDNRYKNARISFPEELNRRFNILSATLELVDTDFELIINQIADLEKKYNSESKKKPRSAKITKKNVYGYLKRNLNNAMDASNWRDTDIDCLTLFGITAMDKFEGILQKGVFDWIIEFCGVHFIRFSPSILVRNILIMADSRKYFKEVDPSFKLRMSPMSMELFTRFEEKFGKMSLGFQQIVSKSRTAWSSPPPKKKR